MSQQPPPAAHEAPSYGNPAPAAGPRPDERCPHCGAVTIIERSSSLEHVCGVCGKARVPVDDASIKRSFAEARPLAEATTAQRAASVWRLVAIAGFVITALSLLLFALVAAIASPPLLGWALGLVASLAPSVLAAIALSRGKASAAKVGPLIDEGWVLATRDVVEARGKVTASELSTLMRVSPERAEHLLLALTVLVEGSRRERDAALLELGAGERMRVDVPVHPDAQKAPAMQPDAQQASASDDELRAHEALEAEAPAREGEARR